MRRYLPVHMLWHAQGSGLLPGSSSTEDLFIQEGERKQSDPHIDLLRFGNAGTPCVWRNTHRLRQSRDIRLRLMRWGLQLWLWRVWRDALTARQSTVAKQLGCQMRRQVYYLLRRGWHRSTEDTLAEDWKAPRQFLRRRQYDPHFSPLTIEHDPIPVLALCTHPGDSVRGTRTLFTVEHGPEPGWLARTLLRASFVLGPPPAPDSTYVTKDPLLELMEDLIKQAPRGTDGMIQKCLLRVTHLHAVAIEAGAFSDETGSRQNAALVANPMGFPGRSASLDWVDAYSDWLQTAVEQMGENAYAFQHASYLTARMVRGVEPAPLRIPIDLLTIHRRLFFYLRKWKQKRVQERSEVSSALGAGEGLSERQRWLYSRALTRAIDAWRDCDHLERTTDPLPDAVEQWSTASLQARFVRKHFQLTAQLILDALTDGDAEAAKALAEAFLAWPQRSRYRLGTRSKVRRSVPFVMTVAALDEPWIAIKQAVETDGIDLTKEKIEDLCGELLLRYWFDLRLVLILLMIRSANPDKQTDPALETALALLRGPSEDWHGIDAGHGFYEPERILLRLVRFSYARFAYKKRLDGTCEYVLGWTNSPDEGYPDFSHGYTDLSALKRPLLILLYSLAPKSRFDPQYLDRRLDGPKWVFDQQLYGSSGDPRFLKDAWERALRDSGPALQRDGAMVREIRKALGRPEKNPKAKRWVEDVLKWMEQLPERLAWADLEIVKDADGFDEI